MKDFDRLTRNKRLGSRWRRVGLLAAFAMVVSLGVVTGAFALLGLPGQTQPEQGGGSEGAGVLQRLANVSGEPQNILVVGVDERPEGDLEVEGTRADTIMLFRVYPDTGRIKVLSFPRDLLVEIEPGVQDKINASYTYNGVSGTIGAVEELSGVYVDHYAVVDFAGFEAIIDSMGGVRLDPDESVVPAQWNMGEGVQRLNGRRTLLYARYRSTEGGDLDRIRRQQQVLAALRSQAFKWRSVKKFPEITRTLIENVETDMGATEVASLGRSVGEHGRGALMTATQLKGIPETLENGSKVLIPDDEANAAILMKFLD
jgi:LCP family protein required for cell wall assembly